MSTQYECLKSADLYAEAFGVAPPEKLPGKEVWPRQPGLFIRKAFVPEQPSAELGAASGAESPAEPSAETASPLVLELAQGQFGLVPTWVKSASDAKLRSTKLAVTRYETMSTSTNSRDAWLKGQRCIIPMQAFLEDDWRSGKGVPTRIARVDGKPMGVAGLWERWTKDGEESPASPC